MLFTVYSGVDGWGSTRVTCIEIILNGPVVTILVLGLILLGILGHIDGIVISL